MNDRLHPEQLARSNNPTSFDRRASQFEGDLTAPQRLKYESAMALINYKNALRMLSHMFASNKLGDSKECDSVMAALVEYARVSELNRKTGTSMLDKDQLTNVTNRDGLTNRISEQVMAVEIKESMDGYKMKDFYICIAIDLDRFKPLNDKLGHAGGDLALVVFADMLKKMVRDSDVFFPSKARINLEGSDPENGDAVEARTGGDEFVVISTQQIPKNATKNEIDTRVGVFLQRFQNELLRRLNTKKFRIGEVYKDGKLVKQAVCDDVEPGEQLKDGEYMLGASMAGKYCVHEKGVDMEAKIIETLRAADIEMLNGKGRSGREGGVKEGGLLTLMLIAAIAMLIVFYL